MVTFTPTPADREAFLKEDLLNALIYLFEGAIAWHASKQSKERCRHQGSLGMCTAFMEARALYEFFHRHDLEYDDNARADFFAGPWKAAESTVYKSYMASKRPANKRMFHLVYGRKLRSGGTGSEGADHLNQQILNVAKDLCDVTRDFSKNVKDPAFRALAETALAEALAEAQKAADYYGITNPFC